jgi:hypothetical protein
VSITGTTHATGRIDVKSYEPQAYDDAGEGPNLVEVHVTETFSGDVEDEGVVRFLQAIRDDGSASFVGIERITGSVGARQGTFLLQDTGTLEGNLVTGTWFVIPGSGTGELAGLRGEGGFEADRGQHASIWRFGSARATRSCALPSDYGPNPVANLMSVLRVERRARPRHAPGCCRPVGRGIRLESPARLVPPSWSVESPGNKHVVGIAAADRDVASAWDQDCVLRREVGGRGADGDK